MQISGVFLGGAVVGGVLAAACGFDFFPGQRAESVQLTKMRGEVQSLRTAVSERDTELMEAVLSREDQERDLTSLRRELSESHRALVDLAKSEAAKRRTLDRRVASLSDSAERARKERFRHRAEIESLEVSLAGLEAESFDLMLKVFRERRAEDDAVFVSDYLDSGASEARKRELVVHLRRHSPEVLLSLAHGPRLVPAMARESESRLAPTALPESSTTTIRPATESKEP